MRRFARTGTTILASLVFGMVLNAAAIGADAPADRVIAMYFHRTERCPTCQAMDSYSQEAVKRGFAERIKEGKVAFYSIDYEDARNAKLATGYKVDGPALIIAKIKGNKVVGYKNLDDIWTNVGDKAAFLKYVQENVAPLLD